MVKSLIAGILAVLGLGQAAGPSQNYQGLDMTVTKVERAASASLRDCPPGTNTVNAVTRPGEQFALVTIAFKVGPAFKPGPIKRPSVTHAAPTTYLPPSQFVHSQSFPHNSFP